MLCTANIVVKPGIWAYSTETHDNTVSELIVQHQDAIDDKKLKKWKYKCGNIGVDSGQAGFFDYDTFNDLNRNVLNEEFYNHVCEISNGGSELEFGAVSNSGYGDGIYPLYVKEKSGIIVAAKIVFIEKD